jgi:PDZ domain-containing protein/aspartyl protease
MAGVSMLNKMFAGVLGSCVVLGAALAAAPESAEEILARARKASGGDAWSEIRSSHTRLKLATGGLTGTAESWDDVRTGRYLDRYELGPVAEGQGFNGEIVWSQDSSKQVRTEEGGEEREAAANEAYRRSLAYWFPERWPASVERSADQEEGGRSFQVVRITPRGGRPFDLWIDAASGLFDRTVEKGAIETRTAHFSDYRAIQGVKVPFAIRSTNGDTKYDQFVTVETVEFNQPLEEARFRKPAPPPPDFQIAGGKSSTTVPFELLNNHIYVKVRLNDRDPVRLLCDTGGANIVTPEIAKELGLKSEGALQGRGVGEASEDFGLTKVRRVQIGDAVISDQVFGVFDLAALASAEGVSQSGLIGYEVFKRFVTKIDYQRSLLTLTQPSVFAYKGDGIVVPFKFNGHIPQVEGELDGIPGKFDLDTGSRSALSVLRPFWEKHGLQARFDAKLEAVTGWGVGGAARALLARAGILRLGGVTIERPVATLSTQSKGAFTDPYAAGNVGGEILKRFNVTFDYARQQVIFERNTHHDAPQAFDRSGLWLNQAGASFEVVDVIPGGPAAEAGIKVGDRILTIDGRDPGDLPLPEARRKFKTLPAGTTLRLTVRTGDETRRVALTLKDLV